MARAGTQGAMRSPRPRGLARQGLLALWLLGCAVPGLLATVAPATVAAASLAPSWGAIASKDRWYGYAFQHPTRAGAERAALAQCEREARRPGACVLRTTFDRACAALAEGNYGEWGIATAPTQPGAGKAAAAECDAHLPAEPCKVVVSVCSP